MVLLKKSQLPEGVSICKADDYRSEPVFSIIRKDCYDKCYICEDKQPTCLNVEHLKAHAGDDLLKYSWKNLLLSCVHCNKSKKDDFSGIINCTEEDPEIYICLDADLFPKTDISVIPLEDSDKVNETVSLLNRIYNGTKPTMLSVECTNLRRKVRAELLKFAEALHRYDSLDPDDTSRDRIKQEIVEMVSRRSAFAAFKRQIIRKYPILSEEFQEALNS